MEAFKQKDSVIIESMPDKYAARVLNPNLQVRYLFTTGQRAYLKIKRGLDFTLALCSITILSPLFLLCAIAIKLDSRGPVIFRQKRVGRNGKVFDVYKFRTMKVDAPQNVATAELTDANQYITKVGNILRKTSIDELTQLINVLKGDMSIVGPRPLVVSEIEIHQRREKANVYQLRPGVTGFAQVNGRDLVTPDEKVAYDVEYLHKFSFWMDIKIFFKTFGVVLMRKDYAEGSDVCQKDEQEPVDFNKKVS